MVYLIALILGLSSCAAVVGQPVTTPNGPETPQQFEARTKWWREAKFGMFIHWGVYSVPADVTTWDGHKSAAEWYLSNKNAQVKDYEKFAPQFDPEKFNAREWVSIAKNAGMKYIVITSKHHDGFTMFHTKLNHDWNIYDATPFKRDPLKELAAECKRQGIRLGFYYSIMDWHHPDYLPRRAWETTTRPKGNADLDRYVHEYEMGQLRELLTNYGPVAVIWFDGGWEHDPIALHSVEVNRMIRSLQPSVIINDRNHLPEDHATPEQSIPANAMPNGRLWETCMTMNDTWGYGRNDTNWKSATDLIHKLCDIASKGGNFLLNVGPTNLGQIPDASVERLKRVGEWMHVNSRSIYATTKSPFRRLPFDGRCTVKGDRLYLQVFTWPAEGLSLSGLKTPVREAHTLMGGEKLAVTTQGGEVLIAKPSRLDPDATVVELRLAGPPEVEAAATQALRPAKDGSFRLSAADAEIQGSSAQLENQGGEPSIGFWTNQSDAVAWHVDAPAAGAYSVTVEYACEPGSFGSDYNVVCDAGSVAGSVESTGAWDAFRKAALPGVLNLKAGRNVVRVVPKSMPRGAVMNLRAVSLAPASQ